MNKNTSLARTPQEIGGVGDQIFHRSIESKICQKDQGKYLAISVDTEDFEIDANDHTGIMRLLAREPDAEVWLMRIGQPATYMIRRFN